MEGEDAEAATRRYRIARGVSPEFVNQPDSRLNLPGPHRSGRGPERCGPGRSSIAARCRRISRGSRPELYDIAPIRGSAEFRIASATPERGKPYQPDARARGVPNDARTCGSRFVKLRRTGSQSSFAIPVGASGIGQIHPVRRRQLAVRRSGLPSDISTEGRPTPASWPTESLLYPRHVIWPASRIWMKGNQPLLFFCDLG